MILLPKKNKEGVPYISYSQYKLWKEIQSFNLKIEGKLEYFATYFLGYRFPDVGWGEFGEQVESYITERRFGDWFTEEEKKVMNRIEPLGLFQYEVELKLDGFNILGYIDDAKPDFSRIRDYKTGSISSLGQYKKAEYYQTDIYSAAIKQMHGITPEAEVCSIERKGNCMYGGGRANLSVGNEINYIPRIITDERMDFIVEDITKAAKEISEWYEIFMQFNK